MADELCDSFELPNGWSIEDDYTLNHDFEEMGAIGTDDDDAVIEILKDGRTPYELCLTVLVEEPVPVEVPSYDDDGNPKDTELERKVVLTIEPTTEEELNTKLAKLVDWYENNRADAHDSVDSQANRSPEIPEF